MSRFLSGSSNSKLLAKGKNRKFIAINPFENADISQYVESLQAAARVFDLEPLILARYLTSPVSNEEKRRTQRDVVSLIDPAKELLKNERTNDRSEKIDLIFVVTNQDLFARGTNYIFGIANRELGIAVLSIKRLSSWVEGLTPIRIQERILKEAAHETGHLLGLDHCPNSNCLMSFSNNLEQVDQKLPILCEDCIPKLRRH